MSKPLSKSNGVGLPADFYDEQGDGLFTPTSGSPEKARTGTKLPSDQEIFSGYIAMQARGGGEQTRAAA